MAHQQRVAIVTGANKGIGLAIARSAERGAAAVETLNKDPQLKTAKVLAHDGGDTTISFHELDISEKNSIHRFRDFLRHRHPAGLDIVINNAGVAMDGFDSSVVKQTLATNYYGTLEATQQLLPLIKAGGRLVNVSSMVGMLREDMYSDALSQSFRQASKTDVPAVTALMEAFERAVAEGREKEAGYPSAAYMVSKAGVTAVTKVIAMEEQKRGRGVLVNACCPGYVNTSMTKGNGKKTPDEGAETPVLLALGDVQGETGGFWSEEKEMEW